MITNQLLHPASIVVVGASNNVHKPGGAILRNLISGGYAGEMRAVNPKETEVQGVAAYADPCHTGSDVPECSGGIGCRKAGAGVHHSFCRIWRGDT